MANTDFLDMSDDDFLNTPEPVETEETFEEDVPVSGSESVDESAEDESYNEPDYEAEDDDDLESEADEEHEPEEPATEVTEEDYKRILDPFKANGSDVQVRSVDEAIQLMQMGANYTKKMQGLQPNLKLLKTLEANDLLDGDKLNYLIDLSKKDPKAIAKLVKDAEIDPYEMNLDETDYTPNNHQVSDQSVALDQVLESIESTATYQRCIDVVGNHWDKASREALSAEPEKIAQINEQMQLGIYDRIMQEVDHVKMFGGLSGMSDFDAYKAVGAQLMQSGAFNQQQAQPVAKTQLQSQDMDRESKRKAAATPRSNRSASNTAGDFNPLAMDDAEFLRINNINV